ncbi:MAG: hypothetical protein KC422_25805, partial [Trueperaceae bacterium]|nr:hypothetical protein [Trueperaceae bacterium]
NTSPFAEVVQVGQELPDGSLAQTNYVWLAPFYKRNLIQGAMRSVDHAFHLRLKKPISKALYPLLETGWFASGQTVWKKRYSSLCEELLLSQHKSPSEITRQLSPALNELKDQGYLKSWQLHPSADQQDYVLSFFPGAYYFSVQKELSKKREQAKLLAKGKSEVILTDKQELLLSDILDLCQDPKSRAGYRKVIQTYPQSLVYMALSETKDAYLMGRIKKNTGAYFMDTIKRLKHYHQQHQN